LTHFVSGIGKSQAIRARAFRTIENVSITVSIRVY
jgi:hypothetical protein